MQERDNDAWLAQLQSTGTEQATALADLRASLLRHLRGPMARWPQADNAFLEDVVQDTLLLVLDKLQQFEGRSRFLTWTTSIAIHQAMSRLRRAHWKDVSLDKLLADSDFPADNSTGNDSKQEIQVRREAIIQAMHGVMDNDLTEKQRTAVLAELKGMPLDDIASQLGSNRNAIYKLMHDARKRLKAGLESAGYEVSDINAAFSL